MKLNSNAVRDILLYLEENQNLKIENDEITIEPIGFVPLAEKVIAGKNYTREDAIYAIMQLRLNKMIETADTGIHRRMTEMIVKDITWKGHDFLNSIRSDILWVQIQQMADEYGTVTPLNVLAKIAAKVAADAIKL